MAYQPDRDAVMHMVDNRSAIVIVAMFALVGCRTWAIENDVPAVITNPTDESRAALQAAVNAELGTQVAIADDALTRSSVLLIERKPLRDLHGAPAQGRILEAPIQFRLVLGEAGCTLIDTRDDSRSVLDDTNCVPE